MPAFPYWFSGAALWLAGSFILTVVLGIIGVRAMISDKMAVFLIGLALLVMFIGWWTAAEQESASQKRDEALAEMRDTLKLIKESLPPPDVGAAKDLSRLSNLQIRKRVSDLVAGMRAFENGLNAAQAANAWLSSLPLNSTPEQRHATWQAHTAQMITRHDEAQTQFRIQFLPQALALREVMSNKLGIMPPYPQDSRNVALDYGMLAGVAPISNAANYLEALARRLPL